jgi:hypothetical protein
MVVISSLLVGLLLYFPVTKVRRGEATPNFPCTGWLYGIQYTKPELPTIWVHHGNVGKYKLEASLPGYNPGLYCLL